MKQYFFSIFIMSSVIMFSACGFNNTNNNSNNNINPTEPVVENNQKPAEESSIEDENEKVTNEQNKNKTTSKPSNTVVLKDKQSNLLDLSAAPGKNSGILSQKEENGIIYRTGEKTNEDGSKVRYNETVERKNTDSMLVKRTYDDGKKVIMLIKVKDNKRYAKFYALYPDGTKDTSELMTIKNEDGTLTNKYIKSPKTGNFL